MDDLILGSLKPYQLRNIEKMRAEMNAAQDKEDESKRRKREQNDRALEKSIEKGRQRVKQLNEAMKKARKASNSTRQSHPDEEEKVSLRDRDGPQRSYQTGL